MSVNNIGPGKNVPEEFMTIIEIPAHSDPVKYEVDKDSGALCVDRFMATSMHYPCNYGYVPQTLSEDGDPVDVLVLTPFPVLSGAAIKCRALGMLEMTDEKGKDNKILAVPVDKLCQMYLDVRTYEDLPKVFLDSISHFFEHYKDLEPNKWVKIDTWHGINACHEEIKNSIARYKQG